MDPEKNNDYAAADASDGVTDGVAATDSHRPIKVGA
jgi:hypothetical protein